MKFGFKMGKNKDKELPPEEEAAEIADVLLQSLDQEETPVRRNSPLQELSLDAEQGQEGGDSIALEEGIAEGEGETIKLVEVQPDPAADLVPPPPPTPVTPAAKKDAGGKPGDPLDISASISNIFENVDDEENPLSNLIKSLPDVAATELLDDLKEINDIIKDWQKK